MCTGLWQKWTRAPIASLRLCDDRRGSYGWLLLSVRINPSFANNVADECEMLIFVGSFFIIADVFAFSLADILKFLHFNTHG